MKVGNIPSFDPKFPIWISIAIIISNESFLGIEWHGP
jgi:hypothetical protein